MNKYDIFSVIQKDMDEPLFFYFWFRVCAYLFTLDDCLVFKTTFLTILYMCSYVHLRFLQYNRFSLKD